MTSIEKIFIAIKEVHVYIQLANGYRQCSKTKIICRWIHESFPGDRSLLKGNSMCPVL